MTPLRPVRQPLGLLDEQNRNIAVGHYALRNAAHQGAANPAMAMGAHDDHVGVLIFG